MAQIELDQALLTSCTNKTILITGAARGIGFATAKLFNQHCANVVLADLAQFRDAAEDMIKTQFAYPDRAIFVPGNIVDWSQLSACFKTAVDRSGGIDVVVANAGIMESRAVFDMGFVDENGELCEDTEAGRVINVNLKGTLNSIFPPCVPQFCMGMLILMSFVYSASSGLIPHETTLKPNQTAQQINPPRRLNVKLLRRNRGRSVHRLETRRSGPSTRLSILSHGTRYPRKRRCAVPNTDAYHGRLCGEMARGRVGGEYA